LILLHIYKMKEQKITRIENGLAIDHLNPGTAWKIAQLLHLYDHGGRVSLGDGYDSGKVEGGQKGFLKIEGRTLSNYEINLIALVAPNATVNVIQEGNVVDKRKVEIPGMLEGIVSCANPACVSNKEGEQFPPRINYDSYKSLFSCHYCRHIFGVDEIKL